MPKKCRCTRCGKKKKDIDMQDCWRCDDTYCDKCFKQECDKTGMYCRECKKIRKMKELKKVMKCIKKLSRQLVSINAELKEN